MVFIFKLYLSIFTTILITYIYVYQVKQKNLSSGLASIVTLFAENFLVWHPNFNYD